MLGAVVASGVVVILVGIAGLVALRRLKSDRSDTSVAVLEAGEADAIAKALNGGESIFLPTGRADEYVMFSSGANSVSGVPIPNDLAQSAAGTISAILRAGVEGAKASGRLVTVDGQTAKAIREGALAVDKAGRPLALVRGAGGKFEHVARLSPAAGKAAGAALGAANVLGAVSTQMQMASIEAKLSDIVDGVRSLEAIAQRELDASISATRQLVEEVIGASRHAGHLPEQSWAQLAPHYKAIVENQLMARGSVEDLIKKANDEPRGFWLGAKANSLKTNRDLLVERLHTLKEADLNVIRMHIVRLWHYTVVQPELAPYFEQLARHELQRQGEIETHLLQVTKETISQHGELGPLADIFHWSKGDAFRRQVEEFSDFSSLARVKGNEPDEQSGLPRKEAPA
ncbi:hypothetical protein [Aeromicrobium sp. NPDC092404]|uniref:hypothetical protein n=1 Tax=Aeromicrobium sp. NPDC092404 TaxID=3154976 RepID=UPI003416EFB4